MTRDYIFIAWPSSRILRAHLDAILEIFMIFDMLETIFTSPHLLRRAALFYRCHREQQHFPVSARHSGAILGEYHTLKKKEGRYERYKCKNATRENHAKRSLTAAFIKRRLGEAIDAAKDFGMTRRVGGGVESRQSREDTS